MGDLDDGDVEPPVPDGLGDLPADLEALADFLRLDEDLLATAAERSGELADRPEGLTAWVAALPDAEKTALLVEAAHAGDGSVGLQLLRRFQHGLHLPDHHQEVGDYASTSVHVHSEPVFTMVAPLHAKPSTSLLLPSRQAPCSSRHN